MFLDFPQCGGPLHPQSRLIIALFYIFSGMRQKKNFVAVYDMIKVRRAVFRAFLIGQNDKVQAVKAGLTGHEPTGGQRKIGTGQRISLRKFFPDLSYFFFIDQHCSESVDKLLKKSSILLTTKFFLSQDFSISSSFDEMQIYFPFFPDKFSMLYFIVNYLLINQLQSYQQMNDNNNNIKDFKKINIFVFIKCRLCKSLSIRTSKGSAKIVI